MSKQVKFGWPLGLEHAACQLQAVEQRLWNMNNDGSCLFKFNAAYHCEDDHGSCIHCCAPHGQWHHSFLCGQPIKECVCKARYFGTSLLKLISMVASVVALCKPHNEDGQHRVSALEIIHQMKFYGARYDKIMVSFDVRMNMCPVGIEPTSLMSMSRVLTTRSRTTLQHLSNWSNSTWQAMKQTLGLGGLFTIVTPGSVFSILPHHLRRLFESLKDLEEELGWILISSRGSGSTFMPHRMVREVAGSQEFDPLGPLNHHNFESSLRLVQEDFEGQRGSVTIKVQDWHPMDVGPDPVIWRTGATKKAEIEISELFRELINILSCDQPNVLKGIYSRKFNQQGNGYWQNEESTRAYRGKKESTSPKMEMSDLIQGYEDCWLRSRSAFTNWGYVKESWLSTDGRDYFFPSCESRSSKCVIAFDLRNVKLSLVECLASTRIGRCLLSPIFDVCWSYQTPWIHQTGVFMISTSHNRFRIKEEFLCNMKNSLEVASVVEDSEEGSLNSFHAIPQYPLIHCQQTLKANHNQSNTQTRLKIFRRITIEIQVEGCYFIQLSPKNISFVWLLVLWQCSDHEKLQLLAFCDSCNKLLDLIFLHQPSCNGSTASCTLLALTGLPTPTLLLCVSRVPTLYFTVSVSLFSFPHSFILSCLCTSIVYTLHVLTAAHLVFLRSGFSFLLFFLCRFSFISSCLKCIPHSFILSSLFTSIGTSSFLLPSFLTWSLHSPRAHSCPSDYYVFLVMINPFQSMGGCWSVVLLV
ncbi:hypothetical protein VP01_3522g1 [Puccinia sorghi]|uniref:Uncharacterized protein n=1 Tax=Puccinia sorghi TaxID=27349 RepID=A0A0L6UWD3_9BASI|nr:hypothetical protein VP01_3522g1 [Puccinia sorghi]